jgi:hypothetical protein
VSNLWFHTKQRTQLHHPPSVQKQHEHLIQDPHLSKTLSTELKVHDGTLTDVIASAKTNLNRAAIHGPRKSGKTYREVSYIHSSSMPRRYLRLWLPRLPFLLIISWGLSCPPRHQIRGVSPGRSTHGCSIPASVRKSPPAAHVVVPRKLWCKSCDHQQETPRSSCGYFSRTTDLH